MQIPRSITAAVAALSFAAPAAASEPWQAPDSPFVLGEAYPETPATCETIEHWHDKAPEISARVSFAIAGKLTAVEWDGVLAYLVMCEDSQVQVLCVTYSRDGRNVGDTVLFGGDTAGPETAGSCSIPASPARLIDPPAVFLRMNMPIRRPRHRRRRPV